jgi:hypothetical protein
VVGGYAYAACQEFGFVVVDVQDPTAPVEVGSLATDFDVEEVHVDGDLAVITGWAGGHLIVVDVSDPATPTELYADTGASLEDVVADGDIVCGVDSLSGLHIWQIVSCEE